VLAAQLTSLAMLCSRSDIPITTPMYDCRRRAVMEKVTKLLLTQANIADLEYNVPTGVSMG
jgi:hypothetical protein